LAAKGLRATAHQMAQTPPASISNHVETSTRPELVVLVLSNGLQCCKGRGCENRMSSKIRRNVPRPVAELAPFGFVAGMVTGVGTTCTVETMVG